MDVIRFHCPQCANELVVPPEAADQSGPCPFCGTLIRGPGLPQQRVPPPGPMPLPEPEKVRNDVSDPFGEHPGRITPPAPVATASGIGLGVLVLLALLSALVFGSLGFYFGRTVQVAPDHPPLPRNPAPPAPEPTPETTGETPPPGKVEEETNAPLTRLRDFLEAPDWATRESFFLDAAGHAEAIQALAAKHAGQGPIPYEKILPLAADSDRKAYRVPSDAFPDGLLIDLLLRDGEWLVSWPGFVEIYDRQFDNFTSTPGPGSQSFRVFVRPSRGETDPMNPARVQLSAFNSETFVTATMDAGCRTEFADLLARLVAERPDWVREGLDQDGLPLVMSISKDSANPPALTCREVISPSWWTF